MRADLAIIGGGPAGYTAARKAAEQGLSVILFEEDKVGGTCLNRGCIPTKTLLHSAQEYRRFKEAATIGIYAPEVSFDYDKILKRKEEVVTTLRSGIEKMLKSKKVTVVYGSASVNAKKEIWCNEEVYEAESILLCTGSSVILPPIEGIDLAVTSDAVLEGNMSLAEELIIIGGGVIGVEIASVYASLGKEVTILEMADQLLPNMDRDLAIRIAACLKKQGVRIVLKAKVRKVEKTEAGKAVTYEDKSGNEQSVEGSEVLVCTGRKANLSGLLDGLELEIQRGIVTNENYESSVKGIYAIGDCRSANIQLAHVATAQALNVLDVICGREKEVDDSLIPSCVYTSPEIASVGLTEAQAKEKGIAVFSKKALTGANGKSVIEGSESGYLKLVIREEDHQILGAQLIMNDATNLIGELAVVIEKKMTLEELRKVVHPHPTLVEMIAEALN